MAKLIGHIGAPHGPYRFSDVRCERKGFLSIFTYLVDSMKYRIEMMDRGHAVVVLPVDFAKGTVVLIRQPRFNLAFLESNAARHMQEEAARRAGGFRGWLLRTFPFLRGKPIGTNIPADMVLVYEMPAGMIDQGEAAVPATIRELHEETGILIDASRLSMVSRYFPSVGGTTEQLSAYIADISGYESDLTNAHGDGQESIDVWEFTFQEAFDMLRAGQLHSASANILIRELQLRLMRGGFAHG